MRSILDWAFFFCSWFPSLLVLPLSLALLSKQVLVLIAEIPQAYGHVQGCLNSLVRRNFLHLQLSLLSLSRRNEDKGRAMHNAAVLGRMNTDTIDTIAQLS